MKNPQGRDATARYASAKQRWVNSASFLPESATPRLRPPIALAARVTVEFEYVGSGAFKALGRRTGRRYCFGGPGARVAVDLRDRPALVAVANLREVRG
jgi:hypothetical protein